MQRRTMVGAVVAATMLGGCDLFNAAKDTVEGVVQPTVAIGLVVRGEADVQGLDGLDDLDAYASGLGATVFLADARSVNDLGNAPISGATLELTACGDTVAMTESASGTYTLAPGSALDGCAENAASMARADVTDGLAAPFTLPPAPDLDIPVDWDAGQPMTLDLSGQGYGSALVAVLDVGSGAVTYSNEPQGIVPTYQFLTGNQDVGAVEIPGSAFKADTLHAVVVTGLVRTPNRDVTKANTALSVLMGGRAQPFPVSTLDLPDTDLFDTDTDI